MSATGKNLGKPFVPGVSGNPKGRPKKGESLAEVLRAKWTPEKWVEAVSEIARKARSEQTRLSALALIADRAYGRVPQGVGLDVTFGEQLPDLDSLPQTARDKLVEALKAMAPDGDLAKLAGSLFRGSSE